MYGSSTYTDPVVVWKNMHVFSSFRGGVGSEGRVDEPEQLPFCGRKDLRDTFWNQRIDSQGWILNQKSFCTNVFFLDKTQGSDPTKTRFEPFVPFQTDGSRRKEFSLSWTELVDAEDLRTRSVTPSDLDPVTSA